MRAANLPRYERTFLDSGVDVNGRRHVLEPFVANVPGTMERVPMVEARRENGDASFYYREETPKSRIVLHYTAGYLKGDIATLTTPGYHVSTPFVVARDGTIYNLWPSKYWSYHLGKGAKGGNERMSRSGVGIEVSNLGWLTRKGDELHTAYSKASRPDVYCRVDEEAFYTKLPKKYRGYEYFATYTEEQYRSVIGLVRFLTARYGIPREFLPVSRRYQVLDDVASFRGITSHVNYREDGKWDIGPAFDWERVIAGVRGEAEAPAEVPVAIPEPSLELARPAPRAPAIRAGAGRKGKGRAAAAAAAEDAEGPKTTRPEAEERRAPERAFTAAERMGRTLDAAPDRVDTRDWFYQPTLAALPDRMINLAAVPEVLDQGSEGACTGFALAAVINFLLGKAGVSRSVSPRMLYELARLYDEWPGEGYEGSSARGAMKGWVRHGACERTHWKDEERGLGCLYRVLEDGLTVADRARDTPGGAFYRVMHREVRDMHSALNETGILYCTLMVHEGWGTPGPSSRSYELEGERILTLPVIERRGRADGGHAVAIVGYTDHGFVIQNSWGTGWGAGGFALLPYEDYLLHATDVWVMQLGVPVKADLWATGSADTTAGVGRANPIVSLDVIRPFVVDIGNNGELSNSGDYWNTEADVERLFTRTILDATADWKTRRILLYLHGGLNAERDVARRIVAFRDVLLANEVYPVHIMWETGAVETLNQILRDLFTDVDERAADVASWLRKLREGLYEAKDRTMELTVSRPGTALWREMKENARIASRHPRKKGGMEIIAKHAGRALQALGDDAKAKLEVHVVAHSAGSIFAAHAMEHLAKLGPALKSLQLLAPAIRVDEFRSLLLPRILAGECPKPTLYVLSDSGERDDVVGPYGKSLLYLVSNAFEGRRETPLLGMERFLREMEDGGHGEVDPEVAALFASADDGDPGVVVAGKEYGARRGRRGVPLSQSDSHGGFDNDPVTLNEVLRRILGRTPERPFHVRDLQY